MEGAFGFLLILAIASSVAYRIYRLKKFKEEVMEIMSDDDPIMDEVQIEDFNGQDFYIKEEDRMVWDSLNRKQKRWVLSEQNKAVKKGLFVKTPDGKLITRAEARKHGLI